MATDLISSGTFVAVCHLEPIDFKFECHLIKSLMYLMSKRTRMA